MDMQALVFAANAQQVNVLGPLLKPLVPFLVLAVIIKLATFFMPAQNKNHSQKTKGVNWQQVNSVRNLIPCSDCKGLISPKANMCPNCGAPVDATYVKVFLEKRNKARRVERESSFAVKMITMGFFGLLLFIGAIVSEPIPYRGFCIFIGLVLILLSAIRTYVHFNKGKIGEFLVAARIRNGLPEGEYEILNNIHLPIDDGATTQIDHIVVSRFGVFVVETKNYSGWIFADASSKVWTQTLYHAKNTFQNPIRQNYCHICAIADNLGIPKEYIHGVVAFTGDCEFKTPMPDGVVYSRKLADYIKSFGAPILKEREKAEILVALREWNASVTSEQRAAHVDNLRRRYN